MTVPLIRMRATSFAAAPNGSFSSFLSQKLLAHAFVASASYTPAPALYATLFLSPPNASGGGSEVTDPAFARQSCAFTAAGNNPVSNAAIISFPQATLDWGFVTAAGIYDAATAGNFLAYGLLLAPDLVTPITHLVQQGDLFQIPLSALTIGLA
jgi:hypothetical protein